MKLVFFVIVFLANSSYGQSINLRAYKMAQVEVVVPVDASAMAFERFAILGLHDVLSATQELEGTTSMVRFRLLIHNSLLQLGILHDSTQKWSLPGKNILAPRIPVPVKVYLLPEPQNLSSRKLVNAEYFLNLQKVNPKQKVGCEVLFGS